jgi:hypothetical protein
MPKTKTQKHDDGLTDTDRTAIESASVDQLRAMIQQGAIAVCSIKAAMKADKDLQPVEAKRKELRQPYLDDMKAEGKKINASYQALLDKGAAE